jgi:iron complex outermembrane recepter protein
VKANNLEAGVRVHPTARVSAEVSVYQLDKRDDILSFRNPVDGATEAVNAGHTRHRGVEAALRVQPVQWLTVSGAYGRADHTYVEWLLDPSKNVDLSGKTMETAPREVANVLATVTPTRGSSMSFELVRIGPYWMDAANTNRYAGHTLLNLRGEVAVHSRVRLFARVTNLADVRYAESSSYTQARGSEFAPGAPRSVFVGLALGQP